MVLLSSWLTIVLIIRFGKTFTVTDDTNEVLLKLQTDETFIINMNQIRQQIANLLVVKNSTWPEHNSTYNNQAIQNNWIEQNWRIESNLSHECIQIDKTAGLEYFNKYEFISTRHLKIRKSYLYITTTYINIPDYSGTRYQNLLETVILRYNDSSIWLTDEKQSFSKNITSDKVLNRGEFNEFCFENQYIDVFEESVHLCLNRTSVEDKTFFKLIFERPALRSTLVLGLISNYTLESEKFSFTNYNETDSNSRIGIELHLVGAQGNFFEGIVYGPLLDNIYTFNLNKDMIFNYAASSLSYKIMKIDYIASVLMIISVKTIPKSPSGSHKNQLLYLERYPGSKLNLTYAVPLGELNFLGGFVSNEATEIIIETSKVHPPTPNKILDMLYSVYSYNLLTKQATQIQTYVLTPPTAEQAFVSTDFFFSFWLKETVLFLSSISYYKWNSTDNTKYEEIPSLRGYWVMLDFFIGFGSNAIYNENYNLYIMESIHDLIYDQYLMMPFHVTFKVTEPKPGNETVSKKCTVLKQRLKEHRIFVKYNLEGAEIYPYLQLKVHDYFNNAAFKIFKILFLKADEVLESNLWKAYNGSEYSFTVSNQELTVPLSSIVRGNYIVQRMDNFPTSGINYLMLRKFELKELHTKSMFKVWKAYYKNHDIYRNDSVNILFAIDVVQTEDKMETYVFFSEFEREKVCIFRVNYDTHQLEFLQKYVFSSNPTKIIPLESNLFFFFLSDGTFELFNGTSRSGIILPYPGVNCKDIEQLYNPSLKPSIICYNTNMGFAIYYLDELIARSLSYSFLESKFHYHDVLNKESFLLTSEYYPGYFFMFTPRKSRIGALLSVFFVEVIEKIEIILIRDIRLDEFGKVFAGSYFVHNIFLVRDRVVLHFRQSQYANCILVLTFNEQMNLDYLKKSCLSSKLLVPKNSKFFLFRKHFAGLIYENVDPLLVLPVVNATNQAEKNLIVVNPFSPALETFPLFILPRHCSSKGVIPFQFYSYGNTFLKIHGIGLLHYSLTTFEEPTSNGENMHYLFHFIDPGQPQLNITMENGSEQTQDTILTKNLSEIAKNRVIEIQDQLYLNERNSSNSLNIAMQFKVVVTDLQVENSSLNGLALQIDLEKNLKSFEHKPAEINLTRFSSLLKRSIVDWKFEQESIFDTALHTLDLTRPLNISWSKGSIDWTDLKEFDSFCYKFKKAKVTCRCILKNSSLGNNQIDYKCVKESSLESCESLIEVTSEKVCVNWTSNENKTCLEYRKNFTEFVCIEKSLAFYFQAAVKVAFKSNISEVTDDDLISIALGNEACSEYFVVNFKLYTVCNIDYRQNFIALNLITLEQAYTEQNIFLNLNSKDTDISQLRVKNMSFVRLTQKIRDLKYRRSSGGSNLFLFSDQGKSLENFAYVFNETGRISDLIDLYTDYITVIHLLENLNCYLVSEFSLKAGNQLAFNINLINLKLVNISEGLNNVSSLTAFDSQSIPFTVSGTAEIKQRALANGVLKVLVSEIDQYIYKRDNVTKFQPTNTSYGLKLSDGDPLMITLLIYFPNYHSYLMKFSNYVSRCNLTMFRLFNPFAGLANFYYVQRPSCRNWTCIMIIKSEVSQYYLMVYDMKFEFISSIKTPNFKQIYPDDTNCTTSKIAGDFFNLDIIGEEFTIYPIQIMKLEQLQGIKFNKEHSNPQDPEELGLYIFYQNRSYSYAVVNRNLKVIMNNLYVSSDYINAKIDRLAGVKQWMVLKVLPYKEVDYYKYYILIGVCIFIALLYALCTLKALTRQQNQTVQNFENEMVHVSLFHYPEEKSEEAEKGNEDEERLDVVVEEEEEQSETKEGKDE